MNDPNNILNRNKFKRNISFANTNVKGIIGASLTGKKNFLMSERE